MTGRGWVEMTDLLQAPSQLEAGPSLLSPASSLDASSVDKNLRSIRQAESSWRLPALSDDIRLDLAAHPGVSHVGLSQFLTGLDTDLHNENPEDLVAPQQPLLTVQGSVGQFTDAAYTGWQQAASALSQLRGLRPLDVPDADATQRWKLRAIQKGYLPAPENGVVDGTWTQDMFSIQREMQYDAMNDSFRGDRFGAIPITSTGDRKGLLDVLNDWTSPSGLMRAAVDLDLFWDFGAIGKEYNSWGDKWRAVGKSKNPLDFAKNLFDAMTGPIDDIVVPVINDALLLAGVGAATNFARVGMLGKSLEAAETFSFTRRLYEFPKVGSLVGRIFPAAIDAEGLAEASWTAQKLMKAGGTAGKVGDALAAWRSWSPVVGTRGLVQTGMRLGLVSQAEQRLLPGYQGGGFSLSDIDPVKEASDKVLRNGWVSNISDLVFAPYTIMAPGTFTASLKGGGMGLARLTGSMAGRTVLGGIAGAAAGAIGGGDGGDVLEGAAAGAAAGAALPAVGTALQKAGSFRLHMAGKDLKVPVLSRAVQATGDLLQLSSWEKLGDDAALTSLFMGAMQQKLEPAEWEKFRSKIDQHGFLQAFADHTGTDKAGAGAAMLFVTLSAAIDRTASLQALNTGAVQGSKAWYSRFYGARNKLVSQLRVFDEPSALELAEAVVRRESRSLSASGKKFKRRVDEMVKAFETDPSKVEEALRIHNEQAQLTMRQLLSTDNLPLEGLDEFSSASLQPLMSKAVSENHAAMQGYIASTLDTFGNWGKYSTHLEALNGKIKSGMFNEATVAPAISYMGTKQDLNLIEAFAENEPLIKDTDLNLISQHLNDLFFVEGSTTAEKLRNAGFYYNPFAREVNPSRGRFTLMHKDSLSKQEIWQVRDEVTRVLHAHDNVADALTALEKAGIRADQLTDLKGHQVSAMLRAAGITGEMKSAKSLQSLRRVLIHAGKDLKGAAGMDAAATRAFTTNVLEQYVRDMAMDQRWLRYDQALNIASSEGQQLSGAALLKWRKQELKALANRTAAHIDHEALIESVRKTQGEDAARDMAEFFRSADEAGYKVVYGQEFLMPSELHDSGLFTDITRRHMNHMTLGNFFGRRQPIELARNVQLARSRSLARNLAKLPGYEDVSPFDPRVQQLLDDMYRHILDPEVMTNNLLVEDAAHQSFVTRVGTSVKTSGQIRGVQDLGAGMHQSKVLDKLQQLGYSKEEALAAWKGIKEGRYSEWRDQGLYAIESTLRRRSQAMDVLRVLGGSEDAGRFRQAVGGAGIGAFVGAVEGQQFAPEGDEGRGEKILGALTGAAIGGALGIGAHGLANKIDNSARWSRYGYVADNLAHLRDRFRFSLSPFFDMSRYTEAFFLGQIAAPKRAEDGSRIVMPLNQSPRRLAKSLRSELGVQGAEDKLKEIDAAWQAAHRGVGFDPNEIEETQRQFQEIGLLGFNPTAWMKSSFHYLRESGMDDRRAYEAIRDMYTYGTSSRSAFEQSVNFIFFPFSFQKKTITHAAQWLADDMSRAVLLHDAVKTYELLDQHYDLENWMKEHLPVLEKLQQLNMFAFGISPGRLGGINAPFIDAVVGDPFSSDPDKKGMIMNLFTPNGVNVGNAISHAELTKLAKRMVPAINDIDHMVQDLKNQGHVIFDPTHQVRWAQARDASGEWSEFKQGVSAALTDRGFTWNELKRRPELTQLNAVVLQKKADLEAKYPGWSESKVRAMGRTANLEAEREGRLNRAFNHPDQADQTDVSFASFDTWLNGNPYTQQPGLKQQLEQVGIDNWEDMEPQLFAYVRGEAMKMINDDPGFLMVYKKFYESTFGPVTTVVR